MCLHAVVVQFPFTGKFNLLQHHVVPVYKASSIKDTAELTRPTLSPDLNLAEHIWDELGR